MKKIIYVIIFLILLGGVVYFVTKDKSGGAKDSTGYVTYENREHGLEFMYPKTWGEVILKEGNQTCPEEDTYRTQDTLYVYDQEFSFNEIKLPGSESFIRTGVRTYELDPENLNTCGGQLLLDIAEMKIDPRTFSSVRFLPVVNETGLSGIYNPEASRLNTEHRMQFTFFVKPASGDMQTLQPYMSFVPHANSPELKEMEEEFNGDMQKYIDEGDTAKPIREYLEEFTKMAKSLDFKAL